MKRTIFNLAAICLAFAAGLAINNACADPIESMTDTELRRLVVQLQGEIESLKKEISELEEKINGGGSSSSTDCGEFYVDGLYFNRNGYCSSIIESSVSRYPDNSNFGSQSYERDELGRITKIISKSRMVIDGVETNTTSEIRYSYSGKQMTMMYDTGASSITQYK